MPDGSSPTRAWPPPHEDPRNKEMEETVLGVALLGYPLPPWLEKADFFHARSQVIFEAIEELGPLANLPSVAALLREWGHLAQFDQAPLDSTYHLHSAHLVDMMEAASFAFKQGWAVPFEELRELREARELLTGLRTVAIRLRGCVISTNEALAELARMIGRS